MSTTPIIQTLLPQAREHGRSQALTFIEGGQSIGGTVDQEICEFLARRDVEWDSIPVRDQDEIRDEYLEGFRAACCRVGSDSGKAGGHSSTSGSMAASSADVPPADRDPASLFSRMAVAIRAAGHELSAYHLTGQPSKSFTHSETLVLSLGDLIAELNRMPVYSHPTGASPSQPLHATDTVKASPEGSVCEVKPGEGWRLLQEGEPLQEGDGFLMPDYPKWISFECRADIFRRDRGGRDYAHTYPWRRRITTALGEEQKGGAGV
jgi:hypothetical protein